MELEQANNKYKVWLARSHMLNNDLEAVKSLRDSIKVESLDAEMTLMFNTIYAYEERVY